MISNETNNVFSFIHNDALGCRSPLKDLSLLGGLLADWRFEKSKSYYYVIKVGYVISWFYDLDEFNYIATEQSIKIASF